jgi:glycerophosphoryl diester phosphodiesterase
MSTMTYAARRRPLVIAHRGASGYRPEHTLASYWLAIRQGADFIEPDLVSTKDGVLVARHENEISQTTDVGEHREFAARRATKQIDGRAVEGFFTEDFTLSELKTLRARERLPDIRPANTRFDRLSTIPSFSEIIALAQLASRVRGRAIGLYPETKHPTYFSSLGLALEPPLVRALHRSGYRGPHAAVYIQSFEVGNLQRLRHLTQLPLIQLLDASGQPYDLSVAGDRRSVSDLVSPRGLAEIARYAAGIGVHKALILPQNAAGELQSPSALIGDAHAVGLRVHAWTFRRENFFLPFEFRRGANGSLHEPSGIGDLKGELARFFELGLDGAFCDNPDLAVKTRDACAVRKH